VLHYLMLYMNDRQFLFEAENNLYHNTLLHMASVDSIAIIKSTDTIEAQTGIMEYEAGVVQYEIMPQESAVIYVHLRSATTIQGERTASFYYDKEKEVVSDWVEGIK
jgi:hypothetical protein